MGILCIPERTWIGLYICLVVTKDHHLRPGSLDAELGLSILGQAVHEGYVLEGEDAGDGRWEIKEACGLSWASQVVLVVKSPPATGGDMRDVGLIPGLGRSLGGGHDNPVQYSRLENPLDRGTWRAAVHGVTESWTWPSHWVCMHVTLAGTLLQSDPIHAKSWAWPASQNRSLFEGRGLTSGFLCQSIRSWATWLGARRGLRQLQFGQGQFSGERGLVLGDKNHQCPQPRGTGAQPAKGTLHGAFQVALVVKNPSAGAGDTRAAALFPGEGIGYPL